MKRLNNSGMTLVEMILSILILGIISVAFAASFASAARVLNRATTYKNASMTASASVELGTKQAAINDKYAMSSFDHKAVSGDNSLKILYYKGEDKNNSSTVNMSGEYVVSIADGEDIHYPLTYREFASSNTVPLPVEDDN